MAKREFTEEQRQAQRDAIKRFEDKHDRINVMLPMGTKERIYALGFTGNEFAKKCILDELEKLEEYQRKMNK